MNTQIQRKQKESMKYPINPLESIDCTPRSQWAKIDFLLEAWLKERQKLWVVYTELPKKASSLKTFCQILVDYIAALHFEVLEKLAFAHEICTPLKPELDKTLLENISKTTLAALNFHDKHSSGASDPSFLQDLSRLGEHLAHRVECEDRLLQNYFKVTTGFNVQA